MNTVQYSPEFNDLSENGSIINPEEKEKKTSCNIRDSPNIKLDIYNSKSPEISHLRINKHYSHQKPLFEFPQHITFKFDHDTNKIINIPTQIKGIEKKLTDTNNQRSIHTTRGSQIIKYKYNL